MLLAPKNMTIYFNRASRDELDRLNKTFEKFKILNNHAIVGDSLLRLNFLVNNKDYCVLPKDQAGKTLYKMYKYFDSLALKD